MGGWACGRARAIGAPPPFFGDLSDSAGVVQVVTELVIEVDSRWGPYGMCNVDNSTGGKWTRLTCACLPLVLAIFVPTTSVPMDLLAVHVPAARARARSCSLVLSCVSSCSCSCSYS